MPLILPGNVGSATAATGYNVANSARFDGTTAYLNRTPGSASNRKTFTFSTWIKRSGISGVSTHQDIFSSDAGDDESYIHFVSDNLKIYSTLPAGTAAAGDPACVLITTQKFRDFSAWMHICFAADTTDGTAANRAKLYINGTQVTSFSTETYPDQNYLFATNAAVPHMIGRRPAGSKFLPGYLAETVLVDGSQLAPTSFGEFDEDSGIWKPIDVSGLTFGTNGFYLDYEDSGDLGDDESGNGNDFTENNLTAIDQTTDTCTNNFATMNPLDNYYAASTFSEGNCRVVTGSSPETWNTSTFGLNSGKWYMEFTIIDEGSGGSTLIGIADRPTVSASEELGGLVTTYAYLSSGNFRTNNSNTSNSVSATDGDIIGVALDLDSAQNTISYYKNDSIIVAAQNITAPVSGFYFIASGVWLDNDTGTNDHNFGNPVVAHSSAQTDANGYGSFEYAPPSGYYAICTKNLAEYG